MSPPFHRESAIFTASKMPCRPAVDQIHAYGANIGAVGRHVFMLDTGEAKPFVSGYANRAVPNLWDRSAKPGPGWI